MFDIIDSKARSEGIIIWMLVERFLREAKVNKAVHFRLKWIFMSRIEMPQRGTKRTVSSQRCGWHVIAVGSTLMRFILHFRMCLFIAVHLSHVVFVAGRGKELVPVILDVVAGLCR